MIERVILDYLTEKLDVPVYMEMPDELEDSFAVLEKTGSGENNHIYTVMIVIQSYGKRMLDAAELNEKIKAAMLAAITLDSICSVKLNSDYNYTDTSIKRYRYQAVFDITHY